MKIFFLKFSQKETVLQRPLAASWVTTNTLPLKDKPLITRQCYEKFSFQFSQLSWVRSQQGGQSEFVAAVEIPNN